MSGSFMQEPQAGRTFGIAFGILIVLLIGAGTFFWHSSRKADVPDTSPTEELSRADQVIQKVSKLYLVPTNETPTVAELQDVTKLADQAFYKKANNGDYLLVYKEAALALIYRPSLAKLVNAGSISLDDQQSTP
jgi:hypothetical protein